MGSRLVLTMLLASFLFCPASTRAITEKDLPDVPVFKGSAIGEEGVGRVVTDIKVKASNVINFIGAIAGVLAVLYTIWGGILYLTAAGNPDQAKRGKDAIVHGIIGIVIIMVSLLIINAVKVALKGG